MRTCFFQDWCVPVCCRCVRELRENWAQDHKKCSGFVCVQEEVQTEQGGISHRPERLQEGCSLEIFGEFADRPTETDLIFWGRSSKTVPVYCHINSGDKFPDEL